MKPYYVSVESNPEREFIKLLEDKNNSVKWWYKNGESDKKYFAIKYKDSQGIERSFYVDFVTMTYDGRIGLFDPKGGITIQVAKEKAEALAKYIKLQNEKYGKNLWGGIAVNLNGSWKYNDAEAFTENLNTKDWKFLQFFS